jgi:CheY-like chemotaxis protein
MPIITVFSGNYCKEDSVSGIICASTGFEVLKDDFFVGEASRLSGLSEGKIEKAFSSRTSVFNRFTHEREKAVAYLRLSLSRILEREGIVIEGFCSMLLSEEISHALRLCLIADMSSRIKEAMRIEKIPETEATKLIKRLDENRAAWVDYIHGIKDPWSSSLYDIVIPTDKMSQEEIEKLVKENLSKDVLKSGPNSMKAVKDFALAAAVETALVNEGHNVIVKAKDGEVTLTINKNVLMLSRLEEELKALAGKVPGVNKVVTKVGPGFHQADIYRRFDFEMPSKVLLVDDEREFVQTLSERLLMREMGSAVAYDGESALEMIKEDEPEVMILDLRMPGIDGVEVLRRVKQSQPEIEVIILTGHGSEADRKMCMELGAFDYIQKPVDIDVLSATIKRANERIRERKKAPQRSSEH